MPQVTDLPISVEARAVRAISHALAISERDFIRRLRHEMRMDTECTGARQMQVKVKVWFNGNAVVHIIQRHVRSETVPEP